VNLPGAFDPGRFRAAVAAARRYQQFPLKARLLELTILDDSADESLVQVTVDAPHLGNRLPSDFDHGSFLYARTDLRGTVLSTEQLMPGQLVVVASFRLSARKLPSSGAVVLFPYDHLAALLSWAHGLTELPEGVRTLLSHDVLQQSNPRKLLPSRGIEPLDTDQRRAVRHSSRTSFLLWGPPGTGKTHTLASTVAAMKRQGWRVAVIALSNAAVDVAVLAIDDACTRAGMPLERGELIRLGTPRHPALEEGERPHLLAFQTELRRLNGKLASARKSLFATIRMIRSARRDGREPPETALKLRATLLELIHRSEEQRRAITRRFISSAAILCSTAASFIATGMEEHFDAVIIDEGSQMPLALLYNIAARRPKRLHIVGDPMQLPPIVPSPRRRYERSNPDVEELFGTSRFQLANLDPSHPDFDRNTSTLEEAGSLVPLLVQRRMTPEIGEVVSQLAYGGRLRHDTKPVDLTPTSILPAQPLVHVLSRASGHTNSSAPQADITRRIVLSLDSGDAPDPARPSILVITPYRKQEALLTDLLAGTPGVRVLTIHKAQGSEAPTVVLDVPAPLNRFLDNPGEARLLWNVALSRAQHRLVLVAPPNIASNRWMAPHLPRFTAVPPPPPA